MSDDSTRGASRRNEPPSANLADNDLATLRQRRIAMTGIGAPADVIAAIDQAITVHGRRRTATNVLVRDCGGDDSTRGASCRNSALSAALNYARTIDRHYKRRDGFIPRLARRPMASIELSQQQQYSIATLLSVNILSDVEAKLRRTFA